MKKFKFEVRYVEINCIELTKKEQRELEEKFEKELRFYASNTVISLVKISEISEIIKIQFTLQKAISLNTLNNILNAILNDTGRLIGNISFHYATRKAQVEVVK